MTGLVTAGMIGGLTLGLTLGLTGGLAQAQSPQGAAFHYDGRMEVRPQSGEIAVDWQITAHEDDLDSVTFMLSPAVGVPVIDGADVVSVEASSLDGFSGPIALYTVALAPAGDTPRRIHVAYAGELLPEPLQHEINTVDPHKVELTVDSFWMPFDQRFSSLVTAEIDIAIEGEWAGVATQEIMPVEGGFHLVQSRPSLDISFTLMADYRLTEADGYRIYDLRPGSEADLTALVGALDHCTGYLNTLAASAGPLPQAQITVTRRDAGGYSRGTLIALTDIAGSDPENLIQFICHELSHYWSYGNAMTVENWLNESFADYTAILGMRDRYGEEVFQARLQRYRDQIGEDVLPAIWTPGTTERPPYLVAYRKGPLALARLEAHVGRDRFADFIQACMMAQVRTTPDMLAQLESVAGAEARHWFEAVLAE